MTLSNTLSESSQLMTKQVLDQDARLRASTVASEAIAILDKNPELKNIIASLLNDNAKIQIRNQPGEFLAGLNKYEDKYEIELGKLTPDDTRQAENTHIKFLDTACNFINSCAQNIQWDDQFKTAHGEFINKKESFIGTYHTIQNNFYSEITGKPFPTTQTA